MIKGIIKYKDGSKSSFSFKEINTLFKMINEEKNRIYNIDVYFEEVEE
jgi:hypothetical protein